MPREKVYETRAEQQAAYRERKKAEQGGQPPPVPEGPGHTGQAPQVRGDAPEVLRHELVAPHADIQEPCKDIPDAELTDDQEQEIRSFWGYSKSETRTRAERQATADRIEAPWHDEDSYVAHQLQVTRAQFEQREVAPRPAVGNGLVEEHRIGPDNITTLETRLARTESYARWRWGEFEKGEVASL